MALFQTSSVALRISWGALLVAAPARLLDLAHVPVTPGGRAVTRTLGIRHLCQAAAATLWPTPEVQRGLRRIDEVHGLSMVVLAATSPRSRRASVLSLSMTLLFVVLSAGTAAEDTQHARS